MPRTIDRSPRAPSIAASRRSLGPLARVAIVVAVGLGSATARAATPDPAGIIGGQPSMPCAWPSTVFLENCTGTLIHPEIVVYAAHCGDDRQRVWFGEDVSSGSVPPGSGFSVDTEYCMVNPEWALEPLIGPSRAADYAFCKLAEPVLDVPIVPPVMGCETTALLSGTPVTLVGFGGTDQGTFAVKYEVETELHYIDDWGAAVIGGGGQSPCAGDSGGPAFMQMPDGSWRSFGIVSGPNFGNCSDAMWFATIFTAIPFIEANSGIDVSVCHHSHGEWNPSPQCGGFPLEPWDGAGKSWADGCSGGPVTDERDSTCGPQFDATEDLVPPGAVLTSPEDRARFDTGDDATTVRIDVTAEAMDDTSGIASVELAINGGVIDGSLVLGPPWEWTINVPAGVWEIQAAPTDWAGNQGLSDVVVIGVNEDPPEPEPSGTTDTGEGLDDSGGPDSTSTGSVPASTGEPDDDSGSSGDGGAQSADGDGCGCRQSTAPSGIWGLLLLLGLVRRRRSLGAVALPLTLAGGCSDDASASTETEATTTTSGTTATSLPPTLPGTSTSTGAVDSSSGSSSSEGPACRVGSLDCGCYPDFSCDQALSCLLDTCVPCEPGTLNCPCIEDPGAEVGTCEDELNCFGGLCVNPQPCPFLRDGVCDEPRGTGFCLQGTDIYDCCPTMSGVCEEPRAGGPCDEGSDPEDCCPVMPGVCEELSAGGPCPNGSDPEDCGMDTDTDTDGSTGTGGETETGGASSSGTTGGSSST